MIRSEWFDGGTIQQFLGWAKDLGAPMDAKIDSDQDSYGVSLEWVVEGPEPKPWNYGQALIAPALVEAAYQELIRATLANGMMFTLNEMIKGAKE